MSNHFISFGLLSKKLIIPILLTISQILIGILFILFPESNPILDLYSNSIGNMLIFVIPYLKCFSNTNKHFELGNSIKIIIFYSLSILCFLIYLLLNFISSVMKSKSNSDNKNNNPHSFGLCSKESIEIILITLISIPTLRYKYFIHHIISLTFFIIISASIDLLLDNFSYEKDSSINFIDNFAIVVFDTLIYCLQKYMIDRLYCSFYHISFSIGLSKFCVNTVIFVITLIIGNKNNNGGTNFFTQFYEYFTDVGTGKIVLKFVLNMTIQFFFNLFLSLTIYYFSPNHIMITYQINKMINVLYNSDDPKRYFSIILFIFQFISLMVYLEIIEMNFWGLNENTKRNIGIRGINDMIMSEEDEKDPIEAIPGYELNKEYNELEDHDESIINSDNNENIS